MRNMVDAVQRSQADQPQQGGGRDMRGPGMDFGSLMSMMGPAQPMATRTGPRVEDAESVSDIVSMNDEGGDTKEVRVGGKKRGPKGAKKNEVSL